MVWSNSTFSRAGTFGSGSRGAAGFSALAALPSAAALSPFSALAAFGALAFCSSPEPSGCCALADFLAFFSSVSAIDFFSRTSGDPHLLAIVTRADDLEPDARRLFVLGIGQRDVRHVDRCLFGDDAAFLRCTLLLVE